MKPLIDSVKAYLEVEGQGLGLRAEGLVVTPVLNWGGFVNSSFAIEDGERRLHLKLTRGEEGDLALFHRASGLLHARFGCPKPLAWVELPEASARGILFEFVAGPVLDAFSDDHVAVLGERLARLHADADVRSLLPGQAAPCTETYLDTYDDRFESDLEWVGRALPPFVTRSTLGFLEREAAVLREMVTGRPEFAEVGDAPIHADLWPNNVIAGEDGRLFLIDWDGLRVGDPALDFAMLLGPTRGDWYRRADPAAHGFDHLSPAAGLRIGVYHRAMLLDWAIDPLADWVDAEARPQWTAAVRREKESDHRHALEAYRLLYPPPGA